MQVEVTNPDGSPGQGVKVVVDPGEVVVRTSDNGMARLSINTDQSNQIITVTVRDYSFICLTHGREKLEL